MALAVSIWVQVVWFEPAVKLVQLVIIYVSNPAVQESADERLNVQLGRLL